MKKKVAAKYPKYTEDLKKVTKEVLVKETDQDICGRLVVSPTTRLQGELYKTKATVPDTNMCRIYA